MKAFIAKPITEGKLIVILADSIEEAVDKMIQRYSGVRQSAEKIGDNIVKIIRYWESPCLNEETIYRISEDLSVIT